MSETSVICIAATREQAVQIVGRLKSAGFSSHDISVLFPYEDTSREFAHENNTQAPEGAFTGAGTGGVLISVHTGNSDEIKRAKELFTQAGAQDICSTGESSAPNEKESDADQDPASFIVRTPCDCECTAPSDSKAEDDPAKFIGHR